MERRQFSQKATIGTFSAVASYGMGFLGCNISYCSGVTMKGC